MLNIYTGRESLDKDKFMFDSIGASLEKGRRVILIVPDQFTLQAEKNAFAYLDVEGLMDLEVLSFSRLANRVFAEVGGGLKTYINNYGKYMMISRILLEENPNLKVFKDLEGSSDFVEKVNNFISEIKNHNIIPKGLKEIVESEDGDSLLSRKLEDIARLYEVYEERMGPEQIDTADYLSMFVSKISQSNLIKNSEFWLSGFDYLTPRNMDAVIEIAKASGRTSAVFTAEQGNSFFKLTNALAENLRLLALDNGIESKITRISDEYRRESDGRGQLVHLESQYCAASPTAYKQHKSNEGKQTEQNQPPKNKDKNITLVSAANYYAEAETAAAAITQLIRNENMRYRDILVICNDMDARASVIKRVFSEYGLPIFIDQRRGVHHNPALEYITALLDIASEGLRPNLVFKLLKTGLTSISNADIEELENYVIKFKIIGSKWKKEFVLTAGEYSDEELLDLNKTREHVVNLISAFESDISKTSTVKDKTAGLFEYLTEEAMLPARIDDYAKALGEAGNLEYAEEMSQVWKVILGIFDQLVGILGDETLTEEEYSVILKTGFESIQMGMLPPSIDQIILGTMQRTRTGNIKAMFVLGANDGVLPSYSGEETLLNEDERDILFRKGNIICRSDEQIMQEEQMAIYRNFSKPSEYLSISYSVSDAEGGEIRPSIIFEKVRRLFPDEPVIKDILNREGEPIDLVQGKGSTANHLTDAMRSWINDDFMPAVWKNVYRWFLEKEPMITDRIVKGLSFRNNREKIDQNFIAQLYKPSFEGADDTIISSPSGLESFSRCPFSFFMGRGIRLKERRVYELDGRNIGEIYHETLMRFGRTMCEDGLEPLDPGSRWSTYTEENCTELVENIYESIEESYKDGIFRETEYEQYRSKRFKKIISGAALEIKSQVNAGSIENMFFETEFRDHADFDPIVVQKEGKTVEITGKIDRLDVLPGGYAKIIDYKSGSEELVKEDIIKGWQLQLMVYMKAVSDSKKNLKPAGIFYFRIPDPHIETTETTAEGIRDDLMSKISGEYKMDGLVINDKQIVESITGPLTSKTSKIIGAKQKKDVSEEADGKAIIDKDDFNALEETVSTLITELCEDMIDGDVKALPKESKKKKVTACTYCEYRGICGYDRTFDQ